MRSAVVDRFAAADVVVMAAAVADFRPKAPNESKMKKEAGVPDLMLEPTPDILAELGERRRPGQFLVGFAAETDDVEDAGREKLRSKHLDALVANAVGRDGHRLRERDERGDDPGRRRPGRADANVVESGARLGRLRPHRPVPDGGATHRYTRATMSKGYLFSSESVTEGHPDKLADQISDAVLDAMLAKDPNSRVACETLVTTGVVFVSGEITTEGYVDIPSVVRNTVVEVGYTDARFGLDGYTCGVITAIQEQSPDIAIGVEHASRSVRSNPRTRSTCWAPATRG
jgi:hypothetical protein